MIPLRPVLLVAAFLLSLGLAAAHAGQTMSFCGDGILYPPQEECDDGGNEDGDGCTADCKLEPSVTATKVDDVEVDVYGDGNASPGDTIRYTVVVENDAAAGKAKNVHFTDTPDPNSTLVVGSVTVDKGNAVVLVGNDPGDTEVEIDLKGINPGVVVTITFDVVVKDPLSEADIAAGLLNQGLVTGNNFDDVLTDDPDDVYCDIDPTHTPLADICDGVVVTNGCRVNGAPVGPCLGTNGADVIIGTNGKDVMVGRRGDDNMVGRGGSDLICAGPGDDFAEGGGGGDRIDGARGDDILVGGGGGDLVTGGRGNDQIEGNAGNDVLDGGPGNDDILNGSLGTDTCTAGETVTGCEL